MLGVRVPPGLPPEQGVAARRPVGSSKRIGAWRQFSVGEAMKRWRWVQAIIEFLNEVKAEMVKVSYPTKNEVIGSTTVVILLTIIVSLFLSLMDAALVRLLRWVV